MKSQRVIYYSMPSVWHGLGAAGGVRKELGLGMWLRMPSSMCEALGSILNGSSKKRTKERKEKIKKN